jgi:hypothetical protein
MEPTPNHCIGLSRAPTRQTAIMQAKRVTEDWKMVKSMMPPSTWVWQLGASKMARACYQGGYVVRA